MSPILSPPPAPLKGDGIEIEVLSFFSLLLCGVVLRLVVFYAAAQEVAKKRLIKSSFYCYKPIVRRPMYARVFVYVVSVITIIIT